MTPDLVIMDWGIGGLSVYNEVRRVLPRLSILYYSDSGQTPYGKMSVLQLKTRLRFLVSKFQSQGIHHIIIACNAASTVLPALEKEFSQQGVRVTGVIERGLDLIRRSSFKSVAVLGGRRTIVSRSYLQGPRKPSCKVQGRIAQPLSALIECGELATPEMHQTLSQILKPLKHHEAIVLACTHYPAVAPLIQSYLPECHLLDPARETARYVKATWRTLSKPSPKKPTTVFMTSGDPKQMKRAAKLAFNVVIPGCQVLFP